ncbi:tRNA (adenine(58)-N(1))-methyltransferase catalytic subunit TRMT61A [Tanacetum coccineum]
MIEGVRDIQGEGFLKDLNGKADVFLDLPHPWLAIPSVCEMLKKGGVLCSFSPCIEQIQRSSEILTSLFTVCQLLPDCYSLDPPTSCCHVSILEPSKLEPRTPNLVPAIMNSTSYQIIIWPRVTGVVTEATTGPPVNGGQRRSTIAGPPVNGGHRRRSTTVNGGGPPLTTAGPPVNHQL